MYDFTESIAMEKRKKFKWPSLDKDGKDMKKPEKAVYENNFYNETKILIIFTKMLGAMPISRNKNGKCLEN